MSHFSKGGLQYDCKHKNSLVAALERIFGKQYVIVNDVGVKIRDYYGSESMIANIVVRREALAYGGSKADLGFVLEDGMYKVIVDNYNGVWNEVYQKLNREYAEQMFVSELDPYEFGIAEKTDDELLIEVFE